MKAIKYFDEKYNCAESVLKSNIDEVNTSIATPFGGGIANTNHICGAITGGLMVLGIKYGRNNNIDSQDHVKKLSKELIIKFQKKFNNTICNSLTLCDLFTQEGKEKFKLPERREKCRQFVDFVDDFISENTK